VGVSACIENSGQQEGSLELPTSRRIAPSQGADWGECRPRYRERTSLTACTPGEVEEVHFRAPLFSFDASTNPQDASFGVYTPF
jgi:hypothetical protein